MTCYKDYECEARKSASNFDSEGDQSRSSDSDLLIQFGAISFLVIGTTERAGMTRVDVPLETCSCTKAVYILT